MTVTNSRLQTITFYVSGLNQENTESILLLFLE